MKKLLLIFFFGTFYLYGVQQFEYSEIPVEDAIEESRFVERQNQRPSVDRKRFFHSYLFQREGECPLSRQSVSQSKAAFEVLLASRTGNVNFNKETLFPFDKRGTCSAMALDFAARYNNVCSKITNTDERRACVSKLGPYYTHNNTTFISRQAAYNTIEVENYTYEDAIAMGLSEKIKEQKMVSLGNYHGLRISPRTATIKTKDIEDGTVDLRKIVEELSDGTYVVRMLHPQSTPKHEYYGHTMVFVKNKHLQLYYDNAVGAMDVTGNLPDAVFEILVDWGIREFRIYRASCKSSGCVNLQNTTCS